MLTACLWAWADNSVTVSYNGNTATVTVDDNMAQYLTVTQSGAHVSITQSSAVTEEITYTLTGTSTNGEFYMSGSYKATIELNGLTLTNTTPVYSGAAVHIQNGKRINVKVITGTTNTLVDAATGSQKGCLYVKGHAEFKQYGTLNIVGRVNHGIKAGEYISVKNATINITSAVGDGISCNQYFLMESGAVTISGTGDDGIQCDLDGETSTGMTVNHEDEDSGNVYVSGGTLTINCPAIAAKGIKSVGDIYISDNAVVNITTTGKGMWDTTDLEAKAACGLNADGNIDISGGTLTLTATGSGGKGMSCDNILTISGGDITVSTTGGLYYNNGSTENLNYTGNIDNLNSNYYCSPKGVKAGTKTSSGYNTTYSGGVNISGGKISVSTVGNNAEGIESKNYLNITGGEVVVDAHDDGINSALDLTITNGYVYSRGSNNDGIDANGDVFIQGGLIYAVGASSPEVAIDANSEENKKFYFTGGTLIAIGGLERGSSLSQTCYQASSWSSNKWYSMTFGSTTIAFKTPASGGTPLVVSAASTPTLMSNVTVNSGTLIFDGRCYLDATTTGGSNVTLSQYNSGGGGGNPPGPGGNTYTITATANPAEGGTVTGAGTYNRFATCTLTATANSGYTFTNWTRNGSVVSTNSTYSFQVTGNANFVANFTRISYTITTTANPTEGGTVSGAGTYYQGQTCTVTATTNEDYTFVNWTENNVQVSSEASYSFVVTANRNLVANFEEYHPEGAYLTVNGYTPEAAPVNQETNLSLSLKNVGTDPTNGITAVTLSCDDERMTIIDGTAELDVLATNETINLQDAFSFIIAEGVGHGTQFQIDVEMTCGTDTWNDVVYVTAIGDVCILYFNLSDSYGDGWNNASLTVSFDDGSASQTLTVPSGYSASYDMEVGNGVHVTLTWAKGNYDNECSFAVSYEGDLIIYEMSTYTNPSAGVLYEFDCNCAAATQTFTVSASCNPAQGTVSGGGEFSFGESCTVTATAAESYVFASWTENGVVVSSANPYTFNVTDDHNLIATFIQAIEIGASQTTNNYLPSYNYYKYSLTQQIYTAEEIGTVGTINSIAFYNEGAEKTRTYDFYLKTTNKNAFSSKTDWITVIESDKVFSGSVTMAANAWTFITFSTPFEYDGTSNLVLVADDNTNAWTSSPHMSCSAFNTTSSQAIYAYNDNTNYNPLSPPTSSSSYNNVLSMKNHILLGMVTNAPQVQQTITLSEGWNWFSTYIEVDDPVAMLQTIEAALGGNGVQIESFDDLTEFDGEEWYGGLDELGIQNEQTYLILTNAPCTVQLQGMPANPANHPITIYPGWNWIGFPCTQPLSVVAAFANFVAEDGDLLERSDAFTEFDDGEWYGEIETLLPGQGYMYYSNSTQTKILVFPVNAK